MQGPTISPVYCKRDGKVSIEFYAIVICIPKKALYESVQQLRAVSNVLHLCFHLLLFKVSHFLWDLQIRCVLSAYCSNGANQAHAMYSQMFSLVICHDFMKCDL